MANWQRTQRIAESLSDAQLTRIIETTADEHGALSADDTAGEYGAYLRHRIELFTTIRDERAHEEFIHLLDGVTGQYKEGAITAREAANALLSKIGQLYDRLPEDKDISPSWIEDGKPSWLNYPTSVEAVAVEPTPEAYPYKPIRKKG